MLTATFKCYQNVECLSFFSIAKISLALFDRKKDETLWQDYREVRLLLSTYKMVLQLMLMSPKLVGTIVNMCQVSF